MSRWLRFASLSSVVVLGFAGCGGDGGDDDDTTTTDGGQTSDGSTTQADSSTTMTVGDVLVATAKGQMIPPGGEREVCEIFELPNTTALKVHGVKLSIDDGFSHHAIVQLANAGIWSTQPHGTQFVAGGCSAPGDDGSPILIGTQVPVLQYDFPTDVYFPINANQKLLLNYHYVNTTTAAKFTNVKVEIFHSDPVARNQKAAALFYNWTGFNPVPVGQSSTQETTCAAFSKTVNVVTMNGHQHKMGTKFDVWKVSGGSDQMVYTNADWDNPLYKIYSPPLVMNPGDRFKFACSWQNTFTREVKFGTSKDDEMCILGGFVYPVTNDLIIDCGDTGD